MTRELIWYGNDILKKTSEKVYIIDDEIKTLIADMFETMYKENGAGLAAVQIGVLKRVIVISVPAYEESDNEFENDKKNKSGKEYFSLALINPEIIYKSEKTEIEDEGCLSFPGIRDVVERFYEVHVKYTNIEGKEEILKAKGFMARAIQHEIDHINGITFIERLLPHQKKKLKRELKEIREMSKDKER